MGFFFKISTKNLSTTERVEKEDIVYTEDQLQALEVAKREKEINPDEIETEHPGYFLSQDTF
jgi:hypothetical protein